jgi:hypothetical protein
MESSEVEPPVRVHSLSVGQVAEWLVWTRLVASSGGDLHVFLPLDDRGIDGIVHRLSTDGFARVQVKGRSVHRYRGIEIQVREDELVDDRAVVVAVDVDLAGVQLGAYALVVPTPVFRELAQRHVDSDRVAYDAEVTLPPPADSPWALWCVRVEDIGARLLPATAAPSAEPRWDDIAAKRLGYRAEMEFLRRAADCVRLNVFKAFPDLEPDEYVLYDVTSREVVGMQVKSVSFPAGANETHVSVYMPALRPSRFTWFVILLEDEGEPEFLPYCGVVPSEVVARYVAGNDLHGQLPITRGLTGRMAEWRVPLAGLGTRLGELTRRGGGPAIDTL